MIKTLFLIAALLVPGLAYAANPSAPFSVQVVDPPNSIPCDIGPPYTGAIPAAATQAGFTHCAANYDFTQTQQWTDKLGTHQWSNLSSWFSCSSPIGNPYLWYYAGHYGGGAVPCDASHQNITTDGGVQVLAMSYYLTDANAGNYWNIIQSEASFTVNATNPFPEGSYVEVVMRPSATTNLASGFTSYFDTSTFTSVQGAPCFVSNDQEWDQDATATGVGMPIWNWICGSGSGEGIGVTSNNDGHISTASYGTFGALMTADNVSAFGGCDYWASGAVSGLPASAWGSCLTSTNGAVGSLSNGVYTVIPPSSSSIFSTRLYRYISEGPQAVRPWTATSHTTYIQRITVWECAGWATGPCITNPVITTAP